MLWVAAPKAHPVGTIHPQEGKGVFWLLGYRETRESPTRRHGCGGAEPPIGLGLGAYLSSIEKDVQIRLLSRSSSAPELARKLAAKIPDSGWRRRRASSARAAAITPRWPPLGRQPL